MKTISQLRASIDEAVKKCKACGMPMPKCTCKDMHEEVEEIVENNNSHTHAAHFKNEKGEWAGMVLINAKDDDDAIKQAHDLSGDDKWKNFKLDSVEKHVPVKEEVEQVDEVTPPGREKQVKALKKVPGITNPYAVSWASYNKSKKK
jgi:hypothetical protein